MVTLENKSHQKIKKITLIHREKSIGRGPVDINRKTVILFHSPSENTYNVNIEFANGEKLKSQGAYVEGGYNITETIYDDSVKTAYEQY